MLEQLNEDVVQVRFHQDNDAILKKSRVYSAKLRHCRKVHRVNIASVAQAFEDDWMSLHIVILICSNQTV